MRPDDDDAGGDEIAWGLEVVRQIESFFTPRGMAAVSAGGGPSV